MDQQDSKTPEEKLEVETTEVENSEAETPEVELPEITTPETETPAETENSEVKNPETETPKVELPDLKRPEAATPEVEEPEVKTPEVVDTETKVPETPEAKTPEMGDLHFDLPDHDAPAMKTPDAKTPKIKTSEAKTPEIEHPEIKNHTIQKLGAWRLFKESLRLFEENFFQIFQIFLIFSALSCLEILANQYFFEDLILVISDKTFRPNASQIGVLTVISFVSLYAVIFLIQYLLIYAVIRIVDQHVSAWEAIKFILKRFVPLLTTPILVGGIVISSLIILGVSTAASGMLVQNTIVKTALWVVLAVLAVFLIRFCFRSFFYLITAVIEEKYYFKSIARSFAYSHGHLLGIFFKTMIASIFFLIILGPISFAIHATGYLFFAVQNFPASQIPLGAIAGFFQTSFFLISAYALYDFYKAETPLPEDSTVSKKYKILGIAIISLLFIAVLGAVIFGGIAINNILESL